MSKLNEFETRNTLVIGVGNELRSDDAVGIVVARRLRKRLAGDVRIQEASGEGGSLLEALRSADSIILIDAVSPGVHPGTIHRIDATREPLSRNFFQRSSHEFGVAEAIEMARVLNQLPRHLVVYGVEGENFAPGLTLSDPASQAAKQVEEEIALHLGAVH